MGMEWTVGSIVAVVGDSMDSDVDNAGDVDIEAEKNMLVSEGCCSVLKGGTCFSLRMPDGLLAVFV